jgi:heat shock protein HslJ
MLILASGFLMKKENTTDQSLYGVRWSLKKIHTVSGIEEVQTKAFIRFDEAKQSAGGNGSCNSFGSTATVNNNEIGFTHIFSTKMYCEGVQKTEDAFLSQLGKVNRFEIVEKRLLLYRDKDLLLEFAS